MKYVVIEVKTKADGKVETTVDAFDDRFEAERKYYLVLSSAAVSGVPSHAAVLLTGDGVSMMHQAYHHAEPEEA